MGGVERGVSQKAKFLGLPPILVDDVARVHAGAKGKADGRARVVVARHAVRAVLIDACAIFYSKLEVHSKQELLDLVEAKRTEQ